jgi:hypothetical protein
MKRTFETQEPKPVIKITDEMIDAGTAVLARCFAGDDLPMDALLLCVFMAMMSKYDPNVQFTDGQKIFRFDEMKMDA